MARPLRLLFPGALYHVMSRGNAKGLIFLDDRDFKRFLEVLDATSFRFGVVCYAFCLMPNHYHLVLITPKANLSAAIKHLNGVYSQWWNGRHGRCGHVLQGRFKGQLVQRERYLLAVCRYVVMNPVRAGLVKHPRQWRWSNYRASAHLQPAPRYLDTSVVDGLLAGFSGARPGLAYRQFVNQRPDDGLDVGQLIRNDERFLGDENFLKDERALARGRAGGSVPRRETRPPLCQLSRLCDGVCSKGERDLQINRAAREFGYRLVDIAERFGLHRASVSRILHAKQQPRRASAEESPGAVECGAEGAPKTGWGADRA
jgi:putative transposase